MPTTLTILISFHLLTPAKAESVSDCQTFTDKILCTSSSTELVDRKPIKPIETLQEHINQEPLPSQDLVCDKDSTEIIQFETSRLAPMLHKLEALKKARMQNKESDLTDIEKLQKVIEASSLLSFAEPSAQLFEQLRKESIWNVQRPSPAVIEKNKLVQADLVQQNFPDAIFRAMNSAKKVPPKCLNSMGPIKILSKLAEKGSARKYHFAKALLREYPLAAVSKSFVKCNFEKTSKASKHDFCKMEQEEKISTLEKEFNEQICVLKELSPAAGGQLNKLSLKIPSAMGDLVTDGPGIRPSAEDAQSKDFRLNVLCPEDVSMGGLVRGALGGIASFLTHEASHEAVGRAMGKKLEWNSKTGTWVCYDCNDQIKPIAVAGLLSHNLSSEYIVQNQSDDSQFQKGWLFFNFYNTAQYFYSDWTGRAGKSSRANYAGATINKKGAGDLQAFSKKESYTLGALMLGHQLFSGYRYLQNRQNYECKKNW